MRLYPSLRRPRNATIAADVFVVVLIVVYAILGMIVHDAVADLTALGDGVQEAGQTLQSSTTQATDAVSGALNQAAQAVQGAPIVGGAVADALRDAGSQATSTIQREGARAAQDVIAVGRQGEQRAIEAANVLGWATFLAPTLLLLARAVPGRVRQARQLTAAQAILDDPGRDPERTRALAERAAFGLPYGTLYHHTRDPVGDLTSGNHEPLLAALSEDAGLDLRPRQERRAGRRPRTSAH